MTEDEKKERFGDKYDPNYSKKNQKKGAKDSDSQKNSLSWEAHIPERNDWRYYALSEEIAKQVGSIPYSYLTGVPVGITFAGSNLQQDRTWMSQAIARVEVDNAQMTASFDNSGFRLATNQLYTFVRHANSGARNYEAPDLMMYVLAMRDIYSEFCCIARALGLLKTFSFVNRNTPRFILQTMRLDYEDAIGNAAQYCARLNIIGKQINSLAIPKYFKAFSRADYIYSNIFMDSNDMRGQFIYFDKRGYYTFSTTTNESGTELIYNQHAGSIQGPITIGDRLNVLQQMVDAVTIDTDALTMSGDILHAFKDAQLYQTGEITLTTTVAPVFDEDILAQVENMHTMEMVGEGNDVWQASMNVTQSDGAINWSPAWIVADPWHALQPDKYLFNSHKENPDFKDNLEWSRLMATWMSNKPTDAVTTAVLTSCGLEIPYRFVMFIQGSPFEWSLSQNVGATSSFTQMEAISTIVASGFDWHPTSYVRTTINDQDALLTFADIKHQTWINTNIIASIHDAANTAAFFATDLYKQAK